MINTNFIRQVGAWNWIWRTGVRQFHKRLTKREHQMILPSGETFKLPLNSKFASEAFVSNANVDWGSEALLYRLILGGDFLDIGANVGYYTLYMRPAADRVFAFEPDPRVRSLLVQNVEFCPNVEVVPMAVGASQGKARFVLASDAEVSHLARTSRSTEESIEVDLVTVDSFVATRRLTVSAIKIDVEGFDVEVVAGAIETMRSQSPIVLTEALPEKRLYALLESTEYKVFAYIWKGGKRKLYELTEPPISRCTKMLFLVPKRLQSEYFLEASVWDGS